MAPPQNLPQLARGLAGKMVDDVGNVVDESGNVLGHALGDLPAMVGKKVNENGEVYGDDDELIGYVTENFTDSASATQNPGGPWGGLQIDHDGNILDATGSVIGRFFQKPGERGQVPSSGGNAQQDPEPAQNPKQEEKPKVNAHTGGSPSDIFLDVKSTTDGIQLTIRIPTTFGLQRSDT
ncbi:putative lea domain protein [Eutypa lata UCREL1]|uniref:Putative lea domain protein n=1 Tax=Eutypa lata (strain UCR-EL1) TaxID=1287681 RepID=M7SYC7_EUTLA|nr:putative lea domain protein [Eutypa lata UCREL1]